MASRQHVKDLGATEANPFTKPYPQQGKYMTNGFHPTSTWSYKTEDGRVQLGLVLSDHVPAGCYGRDNVRLRRDERRRVGRGVLRGRPGLLARHPVPRVLARPDVAARPRVLRVQLSTRDPGHHACP